MASKVVFNMKKAMAPLEVAQQRLVKIGFQLEADIKRSMVAGTGQTYMKGKNKNIVHVASAPGEPPAVDTGRLRASISTNWSDSFLSRGKTDSKALPEDGIGKPARRENLFTVVVGTNVVYAPWLEMGTRRMAARPFVRPAFDRMRSRIASMITKSQ